MGRRKTRPLACALAVVAVTGAAGCGGGGDGGGGSGSGGSGPAAAPDNQAVLITVLSYGRAARPAEICPLLSSAYAKKIGGGDARKCPTLGQAALCPCSSESLAARKLTITGDTATVETTRKSGQDLKISLVRQGPDWKIDKLEPQHP
jgi:hypothetical protein